MRAILAAGLLALAGCAAGPASAPASAPRSSTVIQTGDGVHVFLADQGTATAERVLSVAPAAVWARVDSVFAALGIPITQRNADAMTVGNPALVVRRELAGQPVHRYLDCGMGTLGQRVVDTHRVSLAVRTTLAPAEDGTTVRTTVRATAHSHDVGMDPVRCSSTGRLETRIAEMLRRG